jgi:hypothetical protein
VTLWVECGEEVIGPKERTREQPQGLKTQNMPRGPSPPPRRAAKYQVNSHWNEESAQQWAVRKAFTEKELDDFDVFLVYLDRCFVKPQLVTVRLPQPLPCDGQASLAAPQACTPLRVHRL